MFRRLDSVQPWRFRPPAHRSARRHHLDYFQDESSAERTSPTRSGIRGNNHFRRNQGRATQWQKHRSQDEFPRSPPAHPESRTRIGKSPPQSCWRTRAHARLDRLHRTAREYRLWGHEDITKAMNAPDSRWTSRCDLSVETICVSINRLRLIGTCRDRACSREFQFWIWMLSGEADGLAALQPDSPNDNNVASPPTVAVLVLTVCSVAKRTR